MAKAKKETAAAPKIKVTLVKSTIAALPQHKKIAEALGLRKVNSYRIHEENPCITGMIKKISYLVKVERVQEN